VENAFAQIPRTLQLRTQNVARTAFFAYQAFEGIQKERLVLTLLTTDVQALQPRTRELHDIDSPRSKRTLQQLSAQAVL
jgi:hypothetical protein